MNNYPPIYVYMIIHPSPSMFFVSKKAPDHKEYLTDVGSMEDKCGQQIDNAFAQRFTISECFLNILKGLDMTWNYHCPDMNV